MATFLTYESDCATISIPNCKDVCENYINVCAWYNCNIICKDMMKKWLESEVELL